MVLVSGSNLLLLRYSSVPVTWSPSEITLFGTLTEGVAMVLFLAREIFLYSVRERCQTSFVRNLCKELICSRNLGLDKLQLGDSMC